MTDQRPARHTTTTKGNTPMTDTDDTMNRLIRGRAGHAPEQEQQSKDTEQTVPSFDGGARQTTPKPKDMNALIRAWSNW